MHRTLTACEQPSDALHTGQAATLALTYAGPHIPEPFMHDIRHSLSCAIMDA